ncbi:hypothetical protein M758_5G094300 [Ceratodon purpureus]|nr:hypothetical protein M758_5G094300 [Ceratodon purpureus]
MRIWSFCVVAVLALVQLYAAEANLGINYGRLGNDLPRPEEVAELVQSIGVKHIKIFDYDKKIIRAFDHTDINLIVCVPNQEIIGLARSAKAARTFVHNHIDKRVNAAAKITYIVVGNEILSGIPEIWPALVPAMWQIHSALVHYELDEKIKISTPHSMGVLAASYPPSAGVFGDNIKTSIMEPMLNFLKLTGSTFMMNIYPYFPFRDDPVNISPAYALFLNNTGVDDPNTGLHYSNLFDAMYDASVFAMKNLGYNDIPVMVTETGWPSKGDASEAPATLEYARIYNNNLLKHLKSKAGSPARPSKQIEAFIFALFNENEKPGLLSERNFGLFYPNKTEVYDFSF